MHSVTCQRSLVICVLTNVRIYYGVYRKVVLSSLDQFYADKRSDPRTKAVLQAMQTASSSSCCGFVSAWRFPFIQNGLHTPLSWSAAVWVVCVGCVGKVYSRKQRGQLLQHLYHCVLPCRKRRRLGMLEIRGKGDCNN